MPKKKSQGNKYRDLLTKESIKLEKQYLKILGKPENILCTPEWYEKHGIEFLEDSLSALVETVQLCTNKPYELPEELSHLSKEFKECPQDG